MQATHVLQSYIIEKRLVRQRSKVSDQAIFRRVGEASTTAFEATFVTLKGAVKTFYSSPAYRRRGGESSKGILIRRVRDVLLADLAYSGDCDPDFPPTIELTINYCFPPSAWNSKLESSYQHQHTSLHAAVVRDNHHAKCYFHAFHVKFCCNLAWLMKGQEADVAYTNLVVHS